MSKLPQRDLLQAVQQDLKKKMVFIGGPRQVGKTTLAQSLIKNFVDEHPAYLNWDVTEHRKAIREKNWPRKEPLIVLDEIHKFAGWRNLVKGFYDTLKNTHSFLITGSARLDLFRKGGDSLLGRYHYFRLHPYTLTELGNSENHLKSLFQFGGFPEPLSEQRDITLKRWHRQRVSRLIREDLRELEDVKDLDKLELLANELPRRVGSPLSIRSLAQDLEADPKSVKRWVEILDGLYYSFRISPFGAPKIKSVKKEQKLYLWDWSQIESPGFRFENMVASHLLKFCHFQEDCFGERMELRYLRSDRGKEIDFVVMKNSKPLFAVECKMSDLALSENCFYFSERTSIPQFIQVHLGNESRSANDRVSLMGFSDFCRKFDLP